MWMYLATHIYGVWGMHMILLWCLYACSQGAPTITNILVIIYAAVHLASVYPSPWGRVSGTWPGLLCLLQLLTINVVFPLVARWCEGSNFIFIFVHVPCFKWPVFQCSVSWKTVKQYNHTNMCTANNRCSNVSQTVGMEIKIGWFLGAYNQ